MTLTMTAMTPRKTVAAAALLAPLTLVACADGEDQAGVVSEVATETNVVTVANGQESEDAKEEEKKSEDDKKAEDPAAQGIPNPNAGVVNPFEEGALPTVEIKPIEGDQAGEADVRAMTETMNRIYNPADIVSWSRVIMDNSCQKVVDQTNQELAARGTNLDQTEAQMRQALNAQRAAGQPVPPVPKTQTSLDDVRVNGDTASATVTVNTNGRTESGVQRFARENGQWKVCN